MLDKILSRPPRVVVVVLLIIILILILLFLLLLLLLLLVWHFGHISGYGLPVAGVLRHYYARGEG